MSFPLLELQYALAHIHLRQLIDDVHYFVVLIRLEVGVLLFYDLDFLLEIDQLLSNAICLHTAEESLLKVLIIAVDLLLYLVIDDHEEGQVVQHRYPFQFLLLIIFSSLAQRNI